MGSKEVSSDLEGVNVKLKSLISETTSDQIKESINKISDDIIKIKEKSEKIPFNNLWELNHWGRNYASIVGDKMIFTGISALGQEDGSHINLNYFLEIGKTYRVSCFAKSDINTNGMFRLWCHDDNTGVKPLVDLTTYFKTPSIEGEKVELIFKAEYTKNIRIHLQYKPGQGQIEISDVRVSELKI